MEQNMTIQQKNTALWKERCFSMIPFPKSKSFVKSEVLQYSYEFIFW